jgi:hypothetical protein
MFEEHDFEEGAKWAHLAGESTDAPPYVKNLARKVGTHSGLFEVASNILADLHRRARSPEERVRIEEKMSDLAVKQELAELNDKFQEFSRSTGAYAFPRHRQFLLFMKTTGRPHKDLRGRPLRLNQAGKIVSD